MLVWYDSSNCQCHWQDFNQDWHSYRFKNHHILVSHSMFHLVFKLQDLEVGFSYNHNSVGTYQFLLQSPWRLHQSIKSRWKLLWFIASLLSSSVFVSSISISIFVFDDNNNQLCSLLHLFRDEGYAFVVDIDGTNMFLSFVFPSNVFAMEFCSLFLSIMLSLCFHSFKSSHFIFDPEGIFVSSSFTLTPKSLNWFVSFQSVSRIITFWNWGLRKLF